MSPKCRNCSDFGYFKLTFRGLEPVCADGRNFDFTAYRYVDIAATCREYSPDKSDKKETITTTKPTAEKEQEIRAQDKCSCGEQLKLCHICHAMYCPVCDQYHIEQCREASKP